MKQKRKQVSTKKAFPVWGWILIALVILAGISYGVYQMTQPQTAALPAEINVDQAAQMRNQGAFILDVREPSEWTQVHIPGATLIPLGQLPNRLNEVPKDRKVVVYCHSGNRSAQGRDILHNAGFTQVTSMAGGITQWQSRGMATVTGQ
jgi:rhodanese-related sulfurtransferase